MKQILQSLKKGSTEIIDVPCPQVKPGHVLIHTTHSLISSGTEKMLIDFGKSSLFEKARKEPEKVNMVLDKIKTDGLVSTFHAVKAKLDQKISMGYCNVGRIIAVGEGCHDFSVDDRVVSNGAHAEVVCVPQNLCCKIPPAVLDEEAAFTVLGAIALQGIRLAQPTLGEAFVVIGLGLIGLLTVQLLQAQGCRVLAVDFDSKRVALAALFGADTVNLSSKDDIVAMANIFSRNRGVDGVIITASTASNGPIHQAAQICRKRGRIILIGKTQLTLSRADFYEKELYFQVSCSYGPGRYDPAYEEAGCDYPIGFVRWTAKRNFEAFLDTLRSHRFSLTTCITHRFPLSQIDEAYSLLTHRNQALGILIEYEQSTKRDQTNTIQLKPNTVAENNMPSLGWIGAGNYAGRILIPAFKKAGARLQTIHSLSGISATIMGRKFGFEQVTTDANTIFSNQTIHVVVITSRHDSHANFVSQALLANKHVFVEKPLCMTLQELEMIKQHCQSKAFSLLMVGFNRRFAPHSLKIKALLKTISAPKSLIMTVNAGDIASTHWSQNEKIGGGRIIGEVCHFIDLLRFLVGSPICAFHVTPLKEVEIRKDKITIVFTFEDGSTGVIHYLANGHRSFPKERLEIFTMGRILQLDNFRKLKGYGWPNFKRLYLWRQDKGQKNCVKQFLHAVQCGLPSPIPLNEILEVFQLTLEIDLACQ